MLFPTLHIAEELFPYFSKLPLSMNTKNQSWHLHNEIHKSDCYIAGNFFPTARALIGYFVT